MPVHCYADIGEIILHCWELWRLQLPSAKYRLVNLPSNIEYDASHSPESKKYARSEYSSALSLYLSGACHFSNSSLTSVSAIPVRDEMRSTCIALHLPSPPVVSLKLNLAHGAEKRLKGVVTEQCSPFIAQFNIFSTALDAIVSLRMPTRFL